MNLERLPRGTYDEYNQDFSAASDKWIPTTIENLKKEAKSTQEVLKMTQPNLNTTHLNWEKMSRGIENGRTLELVKGFYRRITNDEKCPLCASSITDGGALSRRDNNTVICSICGTQEALDDALSVRR